MAEAIWLTTANGNYGTGANWSGAAAPTTNDDVRIPKSTPSITAGLDQSAVTINSFQVEPGYTGVIGTISAYLQLTLGSGDKFRFDGLSTLAKFNFGSSAITPEITNSGTPSEGDAAVIVKGSALDGLIVKRGSVGLAPYFGETASATTIVTDYVNSPQSDARLIIGSGVTRTTLLMLGGIVTDKAAGTTTNIYEGVLNIDGAGAHTTINVYGGTVNILASGTITTLNLYGGTVNTDRLRSAVTITTANLYSGRLTEHPNLTISTRNRTGGIVESNVGV